MEQKKYYANSISLPVSPEEVFTFADNHANFSSHMNKSSWMMGGGKMTTHADERGFQKLGSHLQMEGTVVGVKLFLDQVVSTYEPPLRKEWHTVGKINLIVIDHYTLGFEIKPEDNTSNLRVYIEYMRPKTVKSHWLGFLFGSMYAKWCVNQMINGVDSHFKQT